MSSSQAPHPPASNMIVPPPRPPVAPTRAYGSWAIAVLTIAAAVAVAAVAIPKSAKDREQPPSAAQRPDAQTTERAAAAAPAPAPAAATSVRRVAPAPAAPKRSASKAKIIIVPPGPAESAAPSAAAREAERPAPKHEEAPAPAPAAPEEAAATVPPVTITGCLEVSANDDRFRLTDTEGDNVPKARSWRSGFLKKRSASIDLVGIANPRSLEMQVGKKVAATGVLTDRALKVSSVRVVSLYCE